MNRLIRALLAEDSPSDADLVLASLAEDGLAEQIHVARDGVEALDFLLARNEFAWRVNEPPIQLVLLDLKLPRVDGFEVLAEIKGHERLRSTPVVMLTSSNIERDVVQAYRLGANSYVQKPVDFTEFRATIRMIGRYWLGANESPPPAAFRLSVT